MTVDTLALEVGYELISAVDPTMGGTLLDRISVMRKGSSSPIRCQGTE